MAGAAVGYGEGMNLRERIESWLQADPFVPFVVVGSGDRCWRVEAAECLIVDAVGGILDLLVRGAAGWRDVHLRLSQIVAVERDSTELRATDLRPPDEAA
jgi:hypothetical protein